jgi:hypothetical protein
MNGGMILYTRWQREDRLGEKRRANMPEPNLDTIRAVVFPQGSGWVAHCLEIDFSTSARSLDELPERLLDQLRAQAAGDRRRGLAPFARFQPAPEKYWRMHREAQPWRTERISETLFARLWRTLRHLPLPAREVHLAALGT